MSAQEKVKGLGGEVLFTYTSALNGFSVKLPKEALQALRALPDVEYIEVDQMGTVETIQPPNPPTAPPTGIDRIDRRELPLNGTYTYSETGANVHVYIFDTGIRDTHTEFGGRASLALDAIMDGTATNDCQGHGTNVAGIVGGATYGIAKNVKLHSVRVADCIGNAPVSSTIMGIEWVTLNAIHPAVANISLRWVGTLPSLNTAVVNSITSGVTYVVAAGNEFGGNACAVSPALVPAAITVGAIDPTNDTRWPLSNIGPCVDLFAPGVDIVSAGFTNDTATSLFSGTSQASPHVAGVAARYLETHPGASPATVWNAIHSADNVSTTVINGVPWQGIVNAGTGSPNELLHWGSVRDGSIDGD